jgi:glycosyltransferase involved in cell wall biosynthesis
MKVLVISSTFPSAQQPTRGVFVRERIRRLARRAEVVVVAPIPWFPGNRWVRRDRASVPWMETQDGLTVYHPRFLSLPRYGKFLDGALYGLSLLPFVARLRRRFPFELIDAHFAYPDGMAAALLARVFGCPLLVTLRGSIVRLSTYRLHRPQLRWVLRRATRVLAVSDSLRRVAEGLGAGAGRVRVIPNGVDTERFRIGDRAEARRRLGLPADGPLLLTVAGVYPGKGQHTVVDALPDLLARHEHLTYAMVGATRPGDSYRWQLEQTVARLGLGDRVRFVGPVAHEALPPWFNAADLMVLPTESEGWPNVLLESLACGVPVVATRVGGVPEIVVDGEHGLLVPHGDQAALTHALLAALDASWDRAALARRAARFDWEDSVEQVLEEMTAALQGALPPALEASA